MRIVDLVQFYSPISGGVKRYIEGKARHLEALPGWEHILIVPSGRNATTWAARRSVYEIRAPRVPGTRSYHMLLWAGGIPSILDRVRPDLIEVGDPYRGAWIGLRQARRRGIPVVAFYHSDYPRAVGRTVLKYFGPLGPACEPPISRFSQWYVRRLYSRMDATIVSTRRFYETLQGVGLANLVHIPLGTDCACFRPRPEDALRLRADLGLAPEEKLLLYVGRLGREKGIKGLVGMMELLGPQPPVRLRVIGDGEHRDFVRRAAARDPRISWGRHCESRDELAGWYSAADLFVHAGNNETFGLVSIEAQACGLPVLAVRGGGLDETLDGEAHPHFAASPAPADLAEAVRRALQRVEPPEARLARRERIAARYGAEATYGALTALYARLHAARRPGSALGA